MMILRTLLATLCIFTTVCCTSKKSASETTNTKNIMNQEEMITNGFSYGTIEESTKEGDCQFTIRLTNNEKEVYYLDPVDLDDSYKKDGQEVYFKFRGLRMMNRCEKANPIQIEEIHVK